MLHACFLKAPKAQNVESAEGAKGTSPTQRAGWRTGDQPSAESAKCNALAWREPVRLKIHIARFQRWECYSILPGPLARAITSSAFSALSNRLSAHRSYVSESSMQLPLRRH